MASNLDVILHLNCDAYDQEECVDMSLLAFVLMVLYITLSVNLLIHGDLLKVIMSG